MAYDAGLVERLRDAVLRAGERGARERGVFSGRGFLLGRSTFLIAWRDSLLVKTTPDEYPELLKRPGVAPFAPGGERPMGTWVVVPPDAVADDPELLEWVECALRGVRAVPPPKKKGTRGRPAKQLTAKTKGARGSVVKTRAVESAKAKRAKAKPKSPKKSSRSAATRSR